MIGGRGPETERPLSLRWVVLFSAVVALSTALPHIYQAATAPPDEVFTGIVTSHTDQNLYLMWSRQAETGRVMMQNYATAEDAPPLFVGPFWLAVGALARLLPLSLIVTYRALAVILAFVYLLIVWRLLNEVLERSVARLFALVIVALGSGFGAFTDLVNSVSGREVLYSSDLMPEMWAYHSFFLPHFSIALCLIALLALILVRAWRAPSIRLHVAAAVVAATVIAIHPYNIAWLGPLLVLHLLVCALTRACRWREVAANLWTLAGAAVPATYYAWQAQVHPMVAIWAEQNVMRSPPPHVYLLGLGIVLPLAVAGWIAIDRSERRSPALWLVALWPLVTAIMVYSYPLVPFERRLVEGVHLPLAILAGIGMSAYLVPWLQRLTRRNRRHAVRLGLALVLIGILPTNLAIIGRGAVSDLARIPREAQEVFAWVEAQAPPDARFFTDLRTGQHCARYALRHVHLAHDDVTIHAAVKREMVEEFYDPDTSVARREEILREAGCGWVLSPGDRRMQAVEEMPSLRWVAGGDQLSVYRFAESPPPPEMPSVD